MSHCALEAVPSAGLIDVDIGHFLGTYGYREQLVSLRVEFDVLIPFVFLGALRICPRNRTLAYVLYAVASVYLLWATFTWHYYLHHTQVTDKAVKTQRTVVKDFLFVTVALWMSALFLEFTSLVRFIKHWRVIFADGQIRWGFNMILPTVTVLCTLNGLYLMLRLHEAVEKSLMSVSEDYYVFIVLSLVTLTKGLRQCTESLAFFYRIAQRGFIWRNENDSEVSMIFCRIAFSSLVLLIHDSVSTYDFSTQNKPVEPLFLVALCINVIFRLIVCCWAISNSCCFTSTNRQQQEVQHLQPLQVQLENNGDVPSEVVLPSQCHYIQSQCSSHEQCLSLASRHLCCRPHHPPPNPQPFSDTSDVPNSNSHPIPTEDSSTPRTGSPSLCQLEVNPQTETGP